MKTELLEGLNRISENLVLFDSVDLSLLGSVYTEMTATARIAGTDGSDDVSLALNEMADLIEKIIMEEVEHPDRILLHINERISGISNAVRENRGIDEAVPSPEPECEIDLSSEPAEEEFPLDLYIRELVHAIEKEPDIIQDFVLEARDHLDNCSPALLELEKNPESKDDINLVFRCFHTIKGVAGFLNLKTIQDIAHRAENILDNVRSDRQTYEKHISNLMFEASDALREMLNDLASLSSGKEIEKIVPDIQGLSRRLAEVLRSSGAEPEMPVRAPRPAFVDDGIDGGPAEPKAAGEKIPLTEAPVKTKAVAAPSGGNGIKRDGAGKKEVIKVDSDRLNRLIDTIGELVIAETIVLQSEEMHGAVNPAFLRKLSQLDKITRELQTMGMSLRMVAVKPTFQNMARLVRDLSDKQGKKIDFVMQGEDTEIDKNIVDKIGDPLMHMIRNAVDHGIERTAGDRVAAGKSATARIEIRAFHRAGNICIEIEDDGRGIDPDAIFRKAVEKGAIAPDATLSRDEIVNLIFAPGFSTAEKITDVSGRGVGMDVVKRNITELNGNVDIVTEPGKGSVFTIRLPLTLAIIDGMVVRVAEERFIIPTLAITRAVNITRRQVHHVEGQGEFVLHQNKNFPLYRLDRFLGLERSGQSGDEMLMLILDDGEKKAGIIIDELIGKQQIVIKSLGNAFKNVEGYAGCAILSDGAVGLIIDINNVIKNYHTAINR